MARCSLWRALSTTSALCLALVPSIVTAKHVSGNVQLSGVKTEGVLARFAVLPAGAQFDMTLTTQTPYENEFALLVHAYRDTEWPAFLKETLCTSKKQLAKLTHAVTFALDESTRLYTANVTMEINNIRSSSQDEVELKLKEEDERNHYWYFVIDDCSLEQYFHDNRIPVLHYELDIRTFRGRRRQSFTHLSGDDHALIDMHGICLLIAMLVAMVLLLHVIWKLNTSHCSVHIAVLWVGGAAVLDATSTILELVHLSYYQADGIGIYLLDALSAHMEACCDAALMMFLLSVAAGWTLPSSVINMAQTTAHNGNPIQTFVAGLAHPLSHGLAGPSGQLAGAIFGLHVLLAQWGRMYDDDYESYHHLEHLPGKILMAVRIVAGLLFVAAVQHTRRASTVPHNLQRFYLYFLVAGTFWFESLPVWTWMCHVMVPYRHKCAFVFYGTALLQSASLVVLAWLVTSQSTAYHQYSRMVSSNKDSLSDSLSENSATPDAASSSSAWRLGKKAKVRLD